MSGHEPNFNTSLSVLVSHQLLAKRYLASLKKGKPLSSMVFFQWTHICHKNKQLQANRGGLMVKVTVLESHASSK
jgi:hypothetical protein